MSKSFRRSFTVGVSALVMLGLATAATPAYAESRVAVDLPNNPVAGGDSVGVPIVISGFTAPEVTVSLLVEAGELTVDDTNNVLELNPGFDSLEDEMEISFNGALEEVTAVLADSVSWTAPDGEASDLAISVRVGEFVEGETFDPLTGRTYLFISEELAYGAAQAAARLLENRGQFGYLTNITSEAENDFVAERSGAANVWIGATADLSLVNAAFAAADPVVPALIADPQPLGNYYWGDGPEVADAISTGLRLDTAPVGSAFEAWADGEPNNSGSSEACAVTNVDGDLGAWNDLNCLGAQPYLVEFDTTLEDINASFVAFDNITGDSVDAVPALVAVPELAATGTSSAGVFGGLAAALALLVGGGLLVATRRRNALSAE